MVIDTLDYVDNKNSLAQHFQANIPNCTHLPLSDMIPSRFIFDKTNDIYPIP